MDTNCIILLALPMIALLVTLAIFPFFISRQNKKSLDFIKENLELTRIQLQVNRKIESDKVLITTTLQAYERLILFLERIKPANMITRVMHPGQTAGQLQVAMQSAIREEYEHNMSQQLYVSNTSWDMLKAAKEDVIRLINTAATTVKSGDPAGKLAKVILSEGIEKEVSVVDQALSTLKAETRKKFK